MSAGQKAMRQRYTGHRNEHTDIKEAVFLGRDDSLVACCSDDGYLYIYEAVVSDSFTPTRTSSTRGLAEGPGTGLMALIMAASRQRQAAVPLETTWITEAGLMRDVDCALSLRSVPGHERVSHCSGHQAGDRTCSVQSSHLQTGQLTVVHLSHPQTGQLIVALHADDDIVNCCQAHPSEPVFATSGIEDVVRIWAPRPDVEPEFPAVVVEEATLDKMVRKDVIGQRLTIW